jgi:serine/threonine protein kinase
MGVVYRALDLTLRRTVAIKTLPRVSPEYSMRLRHEARAMASVQHPNLALIYGAESWQGTPLLIFEYLAGGTLATRLKGQTLSLPEILELGIVLADVLEQMHGAGVLHRDIKPSNIGYAGDGTPKLLDLGLAKIVDDSRTPGATAGDIFQFSTLPLPLPQRLTLSSRVVGTPAYLSPEAMMGAAPDPHFDLWSLALVLYEAYAGRHPMAAPSPKETLVRILHADADNIGSLVAGCPEPVAAFFKRALGPNVGRRPATALAFKSELEALKSSCAGASQSAAS